MHYHVLYSPTILNRLPYLPRVTYDSPCFPIAVYCRSEDEAIVAWRLQPLARQLAAEDASKDEVVLALMHNPLATTMYGERRVGQTEFYAVLFSNIRCPCVFFNW